MASEGAKLSNYDVWFLMKLLNANMEGAYLVPGKGQSRDEFLRYQHDVLLKLRALNLGAVYEEPKGASR